MKNVKIKSLIFSVLVMSILFFLWWFSGGTIVGIQQKPAPADLATAFIIDNFQRGAAIIFDAASNFSLFQTLEDLLFR